MRRESADILLLARNLRARAEEALALAETMYTPRTRQTMRGVAATYEKLAQQLEEHGGDRDNLLGQSRVGAEPRIRGALKMNQRRT